MSVSEITKIRLIATTDYQAKILESLHKLNIIEFISSEQEGAMATNEAEYDLAQINFALKFLEKYNETKVPLRDKLLGDKISLTKKQLDKTVADFDHKKITKELTDLSEKINQAKNNISKYAGETETLQVWKNLETKPADLGETKSTNSTAGSLSLEKHEELVNKLNEHQVNTELIKVNTDDKKQYSVLIWNKVIDEKIKKILTDLAWEDALIFYPEKTPSQAIDYLEKETKNQEQSIVKLEKKIKSYTKNIKNLKILADYLSWEVEKQTATQNFSNTEKTFSVTGWIEKDNIKTLNKKITKITNKFSIEDAPVKKDEVAPVTIKNNSVLDPFEMVTGIYGMPLSKEPDPTPYLAGFFVVFFGMALTDAGYGLMLASFAYLAIKILKIPKEKSKLFRVLIWGGISTFILGALFGGWFGIVIDEQLPASIANILNAVRVIDPVANPILVLIITMIMGVIQLMTGIFISMYWKIKKGELWDGILDDGIWLFILSALSFWLMTNYGILPESLSTVGQYAIYAGLLVAIFTGGRKQKFYLVIPMGLLGLYNKISGYFSVVLSYSRLLALGLATGIIAMVINMIAMLAKDMIPYLGWVVAILIIIGGHIFNLVINVLGAFIHSARLQFVEFFGQFMEGGGTRFKPFSRENKYINIINKSNN